MNQKSFHFREIALGYVPYGKTIKGHAFISDPFNGCRIQTDTQKIQPIMFVDTSRKECSWSKKAEYAQEEGIQLVIMVEDTSLSIDKKRYRENSSIENINIPIIVVSKQDGNDLLEAIKENKNLEFKVYFKQPPKKSTVLVEYWFHAANFKHHSFLRHFQVLIEQIQQEQNSQIVFEPRVPLKTNYYSKTHNYTSPHTNCISGGRYCMSSNTPSLNQPINGQRAIQIDLKSLCVYLQNEQTWFNIMDQYYSNCLLHQRYSKMNELECFDTILKNFSDKKITDNSGINLDHLDKCFSNQNRQDYDILLQDHDLMKQQLELYHNSHIGNLSPALLVNGETMEGDIQNPQDIYAGVCSGFDKEHFPKVCERLLGYTPKGYDEGDLEKKIESKGWLVVLIVIICLFFFIVSIFCLRRFEQQRLQSRIDQRVNLEVHKYISMPSNNA